MNYDIILFTDLSDYSIPIKTSGAYAISSHLRQHGYNVKIIDNFVWILENKAQELFNYLDNHIGDNTRFIGFSTTFCRYFEEFEPGIHGSFDMKMEKNNLQPTTEYTIKNLENLINRIYFIYPHVKMVIGGQGGHTYSFYKVFEDKIDCWIKGLGEDNILQYVQNLDKGKDNPSYMEDRFSANLDFHNIDPVFHVDDLVFQNEVLPFTISRGCRFKCKFCNFPLLGRKPSDNYVRSEESMYVEFMHNYENFQTTFYSFTDDTLNESIDKLERIKRAIDRTGLDINFWAYIRIELLERFPEQIPLLGEMGIRAAFFGLESLNEASAKAIGKRMGRERVLQTLKTVRESWRKYTRLHGSFIKGLPHETRETASEWTKLLIERKFPLDTISMHGLSLNTTKTLIKGNTSRFNFSEFELNREKYGYFSMPDGTWKNEHWTQSTAREFAKNVIKSFELYDSAQLFLNGIEAVSELPYHTCVPQAMAFAGGQHAMDIMNLRIVDPSLTWEDVHEMGETTIKIFWDRILDAEKLILNNYVERLFEK